MGKADLTRRDAMKAGSAWATGLAVPYVISSRALGNSHIPPASDRITVAHIGVGGRGRALFGETRQVPRAQSVAVADCFQARRESLASVCRGQAYPDFRSILEREDVDAVIVATPDHWHVPVCELAVRAGKHVYVEKPLGLTIRQNLRCQKVFQESGLVFQYGTQQRSMPHCFHACELVRRGAIGELTAIEVDAPNGSAGGSLLEMTPPAGFDYQMWLGPAPRRAFTPDRCRPPGTYWIYDQSIGYLAGWGAHPLDLMVWGTDADLSGPITVAGTGVVPSEGLYDTVYNWDVKLKLGNVDLAFRTGADRTRFIGTDGWIQVARDRDRTMASDPALLTTQLDPAEHILKVSKHHMGNFIEAVAANAPQQTVTSIEQSVRSDIMSHLCDIAIRTGETIVWNSNEQTMTQGSQEAHAMMTRQRQRA